MKEMEMRMNKLRSKCQRHIAMNVFMAVLLALVAIGNFFRFMLSGQIESLVIPILDTMIVTYLFIPEIREWNRILTELKQFEGK